MIEPVRLPRFAWLPFRFACCAALVVRSLTAFASLWCGRCAPLWHLRWVGVLASPVGVGHFVEIGSFGVVGSSGWWIYGLGACAHACMPGLGGGRVGGEARLPCWPLWVLTARVLKFQGRFGQRAIAACLSPQVSLSVLAFEYRGRFGQRAIAACLRPKNGSHGLKESQSFHQKSRPLPWKTLQIITTDHKPPWKAFQDSVSAHPTSKKRTNFDEMPNSYRRSQEPTHHKCYQGAQRPHQKPAQQANHKQAKQSAGAANRKQAQRSEPRLNSHREFSRPGIDLKSMPGLCEEERGWWC